MYYLLQCEYLYVRMNQCPKFCLCRLHQSSATAFKNRPFHHNDFTGSHFLNSFSSLSLHTLTWACGVWLNGGGYMYLSKRRKVENELAHTGMQYFEAQNWGYFLIYAWNVLGGTLGAKILAIIGSWDHCAGMLRVYIWSNML